MRPKQVDQTLAMRRRSFLKSGLTAGGLSGFGMSLTDLLAGREATPGAAKALPCFFPLP